MAKKPASKGSTSEAPAGKKAAPTAATTATTKPKSK